VSDSTKCLVIRNQPASAPTGYQPQAQPWSQQPAQPQTSYQADLDAEVEQRRLREEYDLRLELLQTQVRLERLQRAKSTNIRISDKGGVSVYGLGKYPVTLYADQWRMLLAQAELIEQFLADHQDDLAQRQG
jgi:hypothetical protein